jgi:hypothetical protein
MRSSPPAHTLRCHHCGDVIGVYEPLIALVAGEPRRTVREAVLGGEVKAAECFHATCFTTTAGDSQAT